MIEHLKSILRSCPASALQWKRPLQIIVVATPHKVGSTWLFKMLSSLSFFRFGSVSIPSELQQFGALCLDHPDTPVFLDSIKASCIFKSHSRNYHCLPDSVIVVSLFRDPRDAVVSMVHYASHLSVEKGGWDPLYAAKPFREKMRRFLVQGTYLIDEFRFWYEQDINYKLFYENLLQDQERQLSRLMEELHIPVSEREIRRVVAKNSFKRLSRGRDPGIEDPSSFYRKGIAGDWKNYFSAELKRDFKTIADGQWNALLLDLGYEKSADW